MDISQLEIFVNLAETEHLSLTADQLGISQPALSKRLATMEKELGYRLFDRSSNRLKLNSNGTRFLKYARKCVSEYHNGLNDMRQHQYDVEGSLNLICRVFSENITPCLFEYTELNPSVHVCLSQTPAAEAEYLESCDFILTGQYFPRIDENWIGVKLKTELQAVLLAPRYMNFPDGTDTISLLALKDLQFSTSTTETPTFKDMVTRLCESCGFEPQLFLRTDDFLTKLKATDAAQCATILPESCCKLALKFYPGLKYYYIKEATYSRDVWLLHRPPEQMTEVAKDFLYFAVDYFGQGEEEGC